MDTIRMDLRQLDLLDIPKQGRPLPPFPPRKVLNPSDLSSLESAINLAALFDPKLKALLDPIKIARSAMKASILAPSRVPIGPSRSPSPVPLTPSPTFRGGSSALVHMSITYALAGEINLFVVGGITGQLGIYGSPDPAKEIGVFSAFGGGIWTNIGVSFGPQFTVIIGAPSDFAGVSLGIGADLGEGLSGGAMLLFGFSPFRFLGIAVSVGWGETVKSWDITLQVSNTVTKPILHFK